MYGMTIGAGIEQIPVIELAQSMGIGVVSVDGNPKAPGLEIADNAFVTDLARVEEIVAIAKRYACRCVLPTPIGAFLTTIGAVNDTLGLRGITLDAARNCVDKMLFEKVLKRANLPVLKARSAESRAEIESKSAELSFPLVVKPSRGSGSRGLFVATNAAELAENIDWHLAQRALLPPPQTTLLQAFVAGVEVGVDAIMINTTYQPLTVRDKDLTGLPYRFGYGYSAPTNLAPEDQKKIHGAVQAAARAAGLSDCFLHADAIIDDFGETWVIELSGRPAGFHIATKMLPLLHGFDPIKKTIEMLTGSASPILPAVATGSAAVLRMLLPPQGFKIDRVEGIDAALALPGVVACECYLRPGDRVAPMRDGRSGFRAGYLLTSAPTQNQAEMIWQEAASLIRFHVA